MHAPDSADQDVAERLLKACPPSLDIVGGIMRRTSSRFCLGVEHGDYNGTPLFGVGVDRYIWFAYKPNDSARVRVFSVNRPFEGIIDFGLGDTPPPRSPDIANTWARFPFGVDHILREKGFSLKSGLDGILYGDIPGGGMSRSASLTLNILLALLEVNNISISDKIRLAKLAQMVENSYIGSPCGLLDHVMILFGRRGYGVYFNPLSLDIGYEALPAGDDEFRLMVLDTGTERPGLEKSTYRIRRAECEALVEVLRAAGFNIRHLAEITDRMYEEIARGRPALPKNLQKRLRYIYQAVQRFPSLLEAWRSGDIATVGRIFREDGFGLRFDYEISGPELDTMCDLARQVPGVLGERMLGGGDKGAAGAIVRAEAVDQLKRAVEIRFPEHHPELKGRCAAAELRTTNGVTVLHGLLG